MDKLHKYCLDCDAFYQVSENLGHCLIPESCYCVHINDCCHLN